MDGSWVFTTSWFNRRIDLPCRHSELASAAVLSFNLFDVFVSSITLRKFPRFRISDRTRRHRSASSHHARALIPAFTRSPSPAAPLLSNEQLSILELFRTIGGFMFRFRHLHLLGGAVLALICAVTAGAQQRPLITEDVDIIPQGTLRIEAGIDFMQDAKFPLSGLDGELTRVGVIGINIGLAPNVELQIDGVAQNFLSINHATNPSPIPLQLGAGAGSTNDIGDFILSTKIKFRNETKRGPSLGFRLGVQLPNSNQARGIGVNQVNAFGTILVGKKFGRDQRVNLFGNLGIGILTAPVEPFTQNDVLLYGVAGIFRIDKRFSIAGEINGRANTRGGAAPLGTESQSEARLGMQVRASGLKFDFAGSAGLTKYSPRSGVTFGVTYDTPSVFKPVQ